MSDGDVVEVSAMQTAMNSEMTIEQALRDVLRQSVVTDTIARGLRECVKALDSRHAFLCVLAESCDEANYVKLIEGLCAENNISLIKVSDSKQLGEWVGFCKIDKKDEVRKVVGCSCVVIKSRPEESASSRFLLENIKSASS